MAIVRNCLTGATSVTEREVVDAYVLLSITQAVRLSFFSKVVDMPQEINFTASGVAYVIRRSATDQGMDVFRADGRFMTPEEKGEVWRAWSNSFVADDPNQTMANLVKFSQTGQSPQSNAPVALSRDTLLILGGVFLFIVLIRL